MSSLRAVVAAALFVACGPGRGAATSVKDGGPPVAAANLDAELVRRPAATRIVAIGDLHGDADAARAALRLGGAIDAEDRWIGGDLVVVQVGDQLDRGDQEQELIDLLDRLARDAAADGGAVIVLNGNHELMNVAGDFRYVTPGGMDAFGGAEGRRAAFAPGGPWAKRLATRPIYAIVGDTLFAHGGVLPAHLDHGLERMDREARAWLRGESEELPVALLDQQSPLWTRAYGTPDARACAKAREVLERLRLVRMVVAHTVQEEGAASACDGQVWRIDVGLARRYGGPIQVLVIEAGGARVLSASR
jgi:hypothetical protein